MTGLLLLFLIVYSACGEALSLIVNVTSFASVPFGGEPLFAKLFWGIFPAFLSTILIGRSEVNKHCPDTPNDKIDHWGLLFAGCPAWLRYFFWACFAYAFALVIFIFVFLRTREPYLMSAAGTAFCMVFYAMGLAAATAAYRRSNSSRRPFR